MPNNEQETVREFMDHVEIQRAQATMGMLGRVAASVDCGKYVSTLDHAETIGPFLDPTAYIRSPHDLRRETTELARLFKQVVGQWQKCMVELDAVLSGEANTL